MHLSKWDLGLYAAAVSISAIMITLRYETAILCPNLPWMCHGSCLAVPRVRRDWCACAGAFGVSWWRAVARAVHWAYLAWVRCGPHSYRRFSCCSVSNDEHMACACFEIKVSLLRVVVCRCGFDSASVGDHENRCVWPSSVSWWTDLWRGVTRQNDPQGG